MITEIFNPTDNTVTITSDLFLFENQTISYVEWYARRFVLQHLNANGKLNIVLDGWQWREAYLLCDGLGQINEKWAIEQSWDWSHVRDSSYPTMVKVADWIANKKWADKSIEVIANRMLEDAKRLNVNPLELC
jgi:hypothetical protein